MDTNKENTKMWMELSDGKESDWRDCFKICQRAFQNDPFYTYTHPDPAIRREFLKVYFDYLYPAILQDGKGILVVIKAEDEEGIKIIGGMSVTMYQDEELENDHTALLAVDRNGWMKHLRRDDWECETYYEKLQELADKLGTNLMPGVFQIVDDGYRGKGIGSKFVMQAVQMMSDEVVKRKRLAGIAKPKPPLAYCICDHERSRNFTKKSGFIEVAQLRTNNVGVLGKDTSHIWIFLLPPEDPSWIYEARKMFVYPSNL
uniref:uncharacterized protein LOC120334097 isoform X1 n=2 Tax=Styela clava TaxID=7725 RepID=UPI00193AA8C1|nr:uncharacterized protein LOC120334097 isoform X1 [Styela clava]